MTHPRILFILHLPPPVHGAAMVGKYIRDSELINSEFECRYVNLATAADLEDIGKVGLKKVFSFLRLLKEVWHQVKCFRPAMVYITPNAKGGAFCKDFIVVEMLKLMGCRVVAHYHNKGVATRQDRWLDDRLYRLFFRNLKVILLGEVLWQDIRKYADRKDVLVCPNGIPRGNALTTAEKREEGTKRLLFLSNLIESKGVLVLLDACRILAHDNVRFECVFVGAETDEMTAATFEREVEARGLKDYVSYAGKKYGSDKEDEFDKADIFVFPTFYPNECFPLVLLEAMQHALPCISTSEGAIPGIIEEGVTGLIVPRQSPEATAEAISRLLDSAELRRRMGHAGRQRYEQLFTLQAFEQRMCSILHQLV